MNWNDIFTDICDFHDYECPLTIVMAEAEYSGITTQQTHNCNKHVIITSKRDFDVIITLWVCRVGEHHGCLSPGLCVARPSVTML